MSQTKFSSNDIRVGHLNVYHLYPKLADVSVYLSTPEPFHIFGFSETRLNTNIPDVSIQTPGFSVMRRDPVTYGQTGLAVYVHHTVQQFVRRRPDLETKEVECMWLELKTPRKPPLLIGFVYRNPAATFEWYDDFLSMCDRICNTSTLLLGDFNIDMLKPHPAWDSTITLLGLKQLVNSSTRITSTTSTLIDHIYSTKPEAISNVSVGNLSISDHYPISCTWSAKLPKARKGCHSYITYRTFKKFKESEFLSELNNAPFCTIYNLNNPDGALSVWYAIFLNILNRHAPLRRKRVKYASLPPWLNQEIIQAMQKRNELRQQKRFTEYKRERNRVKYLVRLARKSFVDRLIKQDRDVKTLWRAMAVVTGGNGKRSPVIPSSLTADNFNDHFLSIAESLVPSQINSHPYTCPRTLTDFCNSRNDGLQDFQLPPLAVHEVGKFISSMKNKKSAGPDEISTKILKLSLPYVIESLTYIYNLSIQQGIFPTELKRAKVIPIPKTKDVSDINNYRPISLLSVLSKPLERHMHKHLLSYLEQRELIHPLQSGFRPKHSRLSHGLSTPY
jgi:hypothetical protein